MIDYENQIYTNVVTALRTSFPGINTQSVTTYSPEKFPLVCIEEADNYSNRATRDSGSTENMADIMYEITVYSNKATTAKSECKSIFAVVDSALESLGFTRTVRTVIRMNDAQICRMVGRYEATIDTNGKIYRR